VSLIEEWCIAVLKCKPEQIRTVLPAVYHFVEALNDVKSLNFLIKDRDEDEAVVILRVMVEPKQKHIIKSKIAYKLGTLVSIDKFAVEPSPDNSLSEYAAWNPEKKVAKFGLKKFDDFIDFLQALSKLTIEIMEKDYFGSNERVELIRAFTSMLGCAEYGCLSPKAMEIGYYDIIADKYIQHIKEDFQ